MPARHRPRFHVRPATGWVNDPNGIGWWGEAWHVMCQYNAAAPVWGNITWAHLSSTDLVTWQEHPVALAPRAGELDDDGIWSGVAHVVDGEATLVYTAIPSDRGTDGARVVLAHPVGEGWEQSTRAVTGEAPPHIQDIRDPFLVQVGDRRLAVQGAGTRDGVPLVLLYDASELENWRYLGVLLRGDDPAAARWAPGRLWECPQLVELDGTWVLVLSLWDDLASGVKEEFGPQRVAWLAGSLTSEGADDPEGLRFVVTSGGPFDEGSCLYAPQIALDPRTGDALAWGWAWEGTRSVTPPPAPGEPERDWAGILTFPRVLSLGPDGLRSAFPAPVLEAFGVPEPYEGELPATTWLARVDATTGPATVVVTASLGAGQVELVGQEVVVTFDGSILEALVDGVGVTHRLYPVAGETFEVRASGSDGAALPVLAAVPAVAQPGDVADGREA